MDMLPLLPPTDLLSITPDVLDVDLFAPAFTYETIPPTYGCYAFYYGDTGEVVYIGSACANGLDPGGTGLRMRLRFYRGRGKEERVTATVAKVRAAAAGPRKLLLKCWSSTSAGDCRKYEDEAVRQHRPPLNWVGTKERTPEAAVALKNQYMRNSTGRNAAIDRFNPDAAFKCRSCEQVKPSGDFPRNRYRANGIMYICRVCFAPIGRAKQAAHRVRKAKAMKTEVNRPLV